MLTAAAIAGVSAAALPAAAPPNFDIVASGPVTFTFEPAPCGGYRIVGSAAASGTHIGESSTFSTSGLDPISSRASTTSTDRRWSGDCNDDLAFAITGGTGRFSDASGGGRLTAHGNIYDFPTIVSSRLKGTIADAPALARRASDRSPGYRHT
jgi:hypothetical protein